MNNTLLLDPVRVLRGIEYSVELSAVLIEAGVLTAFGEESRQKAIGLGVASTAAPTQIVAPCLVDPHSILETPCNGTHETIESLRRCAASAGYGQIALLPRGRVWRDRPDCLQDFSRGSTSDVHLHLWGGFSQNGRSKGLTPHRDLIEHGAIGLADDDAFISPQLLEQGLLLGEMGSFPVLVAPRDPVLQGDGMVREGVEALRAGWPQDPLTSEILPLIQLLALQKRHHDRHLRLMNLSTAAAVEHLVAYGRDAPLSSVNWWHLLADRNGLVAEALGWRVHPSLGGPKDREQLIDAVLNRTITAISVHAISLDDEDMLLPSDQRRPGLCGHHLVLPALWEALVNQHKGSIESLWHALSFGPSALIDQPPEQLSQGSRRWLLFDPNHLWTVRRDDPQAPRGANVPFLGQQLTGRVIASGLSY
ncbi:dihydroorotase [Synechococcus sp. M16CYN]|uniref:dihydroorotase n=1 Tax=Synechococcus sp. M16CYN TaxID=3103139 RepID=UPI003250BBFE